MRTGDLNRIHADIRADIMRGRAALAASARSPAHPNERNRQTIARLLELLWHSDGDVRRAAAHALPGGDGQNAHIPHFGHFVGAFLRGLADSGRSDEGHGQRFPATQAERYDRVANVLRALLAQNISEIRGVGNMRYSFLSSALYLAVFATCRDVLMTLGRLQISDAQAELCGLLWSLSELSPSRRLNGGDMETLARFAGDALAMLPPDDIPEFWRELTGALPARRFAMVSALACVQDNRAVPHLLDALHARHAQPAGIVVPIIGCLARLEDERALPLLQDLATHPSKPVRAAAMSALAAIGRAGHKHPSKTLLRAARAHNGNDSETMLRPVPVNHHNTEPPEEMLRPAGSTPVRRARYE